MCIAIYHDQSCPLSPEEFNTSWSNNPDGGGFAYFDEANEIAIKKSMDKGEMYDMYYKAIEEYGQTSPFLVHFRIATHGSVNLSNAHPFRVNANTVMIHNGMIPVIMDKKQKRSDTRVFVEEYLPRLPKNWYDDEYLVDMVQEYIGNSKLVFMTNDPKLDSYLYIMNEKMGHWSEDGKTWYSNKSYCATKTYSLTSWNQPSMNEPNEDLIVLPKCKVCGENAVFDDMCYNCESCAMCQMHDDICACYKSIHNMTDSQFANGWSE
jgi:predicted glutamine amidotransferase